MKAIPAGALGHAAPFILLPLAFAAMSLSQHRSASGQAGGFFVFGYLALLTALLRTLAFALVTGVFASWRRQAPGFAMAIGAAFGIVAYVLQLTGLELFALALLPRALQRAHPLVAALAFQALPGVLSALLAVAVARVVRPSGARPQAVPG